MRPYSRDDSPFFNEEHSKQVYWCLRPPPLRSGQFPWKKNHNRSILTFITTEMLHEGEIFESHEEEEVILGNGYADNYKE